MQKLMVKISINEVDISKIKLGQTAGITYDAIKEKTFEGSVLKIDSIGNSNQGVITYNIYLAITDVDPSIKPAMSANVTIVVEKHDNVLSVSNSAIKPYQGGKAVQILGPDKVNGREVRTLQYIPVKVGLRGVEKTEITEGIAEGQIIVLSTSSAKATGLLGR